MSLYSTSTSQNLEMSHKERGEGDFEGIYFPLDGFGCLIHFKSYPKKLKISVAHCRLNLTTLAATSNFNKDFYSQACILYLILAY